MRFQEAVERTPEIVRAFRPGLQALRRQDRSRIQRRDSLTRLAGSVNLDDALSDRYPHAARWDYGIGVERTSRRDNRVLWIEVHSASSAHVSDVIAKHQWLVAWLGRSAPQLGGLRREFIWLATGSVYIRRGTPQHRRLAKTGIRLVGSQLLI
jgi:hypothetical protein